MLVSDLLTLIANSDAKSFGLVDKGKFQIKEEAYPFINVCLNRALRKIFTDFCLIQREVIIKSREQYDRYFLRSEHSIINDDPSVAKYLIDTDDEPFDDKLVKILRVTDELHNKYQLNVVGAEFSILTPEYDCIEIEHPEKELAYSVIYQACCDRFDFSSISENINVPVYVEEALIFYMQYLIANKQSNAVSQQKAQLLLMRYNEEVQTLLSTGKLGNTTTYQNNLFELKGWK